MGCAWAHRRLTELQNSVDFKKLSRLIVRIGPPSATPNPAQKACTEDDACCNDEDKRGGVVPGEPRPAAVGSATIARRHLEDDAQRKTRQSENDQAPAEYHKDLRIAESHG